MSWRTESGQAMVEAAFLIPVLFVVLLLLIQPGIVFYDRMVMNYAAADGCRLLATTSESAGVSQARCEELIKRHLGAIPQQELFHVHDGGCSYELELLGNDSSEEVRVKITNKLKLLPLFSGLGSALGVAQDGCISIEVEHCAQTQPDWIAASSSGHDPYSWVHGRD